MGKGLVSVIMSTYNETENELRAAIESILKQTYNEIEFIIIIDNPSNKFLKEVIDEYKRIDNRISLVINEENIGLAKSLNKGIDVASGEYIARMDADDISFENRIKDTLKFLKDHDYDLVCTERIDINERNELLPEKSRLPKNEKVNKLLPIGNFISHPTVLMKAKIVKKVKGYRNLSAAQDYDLWLRLLSSGYKIGVLHKPLLYYRLRNKGISKSNRFRQRIMTRYVKYLYRIRKENLNKDYFSKENMREFLEKHNYYNKDFRDRYNEAHFIFEKGINNFKRGKRVSGFTNILLSLLGHKEIKHMVYNLAIYKLKSR